VDPATAVIAVDGRSLGAPAAHVHLVLHKPVGVTSTVRDRHAERTVIEMVPGDLRPPGVRLYPVGRLDKDSEGLVLLTNDGAWAERVLHPRHEVEREYAIALAHPLEGRHVATLRHGIAMEEGLATLDHLRPMTATELRRVADLVDPPPAVGLTWYRATLRQGWRRQLRRMFGAIGAPVERLVRVRIGPVRIDDLAAGAIRPLTTREVRALAAGPDPDPGRRDEEG
jgi:23S rRNA pseudouridine2605 synthase